MSLCQRVKFQIFFHLSAPFPVSVYNFISSLPVLFSRILHLFRKKTICERRNFSKAYLVICFLTACRNWVKCTIVLRILHTVVCKISVWLKFASNILPLNLRQSMLCLIHSTTFAELIAHSFCCLCIIDLQWLADIHQFSKLSSVVLR